MGGGRSICENVLSSYVHFSKNGKSTAPSKFVEFTADLTGILVCSDVIVDLWFCYKIGTVMDKMREYWMVKNE